MTYLELVNKAIRESGVDLDELTSSNFASPPDRYHVKFKEWVNDAWKEIQMERNWEFTQTMHLKTNTSGNNQGVVGFYPSPLNDLVTITNTTDCTYPYLAIQASSGLSAVNFVGGNWVRGRRSGAQARLICDVQVDTNAGSYAQGPNPEQGFRLRLYVAGGTGVFEFGEPISVYNSANETLVENTAATIVDFNAYRITSYHGLENLVNATTEFSNSTDGMVIKQDSFKIVPRGTVSFNGTTSPLTVPVDVTVYGDYEASKLKWLDWQDFKALAYGSDGTMLGKEDVLGIPEYVTKDDMGYYRFFPTFDYTSSIVWDVYCDVQIQIVDMPSVSANFMPKPLPYQFHEMIAWRAVMYYANDDSKPDKWRTARGRYEFYKRRLEEQLIEQPKWQDSPYKRGIGHGIR